jgi:hypothetical protein
VEIWRRPILAGGLACDGGRYHTTFFWVCVHIRCCGHGHLGFRPYGGSLWKSAKVSKALLPHHSVPRLGSACPQSGIAPWARRDRPSLAVSRLPRHPCRGAHCAIPACGHRGLTGRLRSRSKARSKAEPQQQPDQKQSYGNRRVRARSCVPCGSWLVGSPHRRQAGSYS